MLINGQYQDFRYLLGIIGFYLWDLVLVLFLVSFVIVLDGDRLIHGCDYFNRMIEGSLLIHMLYVFHAINLKLLNVVFLSP